MIFSYCTWARILFVLVKLLCSMLMQVFYLFLLCNVWLFKAHIFYLIYDLMTYIFFFFYFLISDNNFFFNWSQAFCFSRFSLFHLLPYKLGSLMADHYMSSYLDYPLNQEFFSRVIFWISSHALAKLYLFLCFKTCLKNQFRPFQQGLN